MADHSRFSHSCSPCNVPGFAIIRRPLKFFISKCCPDKKSKKSPDHNKTKTKKNVDKHYSGSFKNSTLEDYLNRNPSSQSSRSMLRTMSGSRLSRSTSQGYARFTRSASRISQTAVPPTKSSLLGTASRRQKSLDSESAAALQRAVSKTLSRKGSVIMYSNSNGLLRPFPLEKQLDCSLEELCFGCVKMVEIKKDTVTENGQIIEEAELLAIKVKPGWRKGTKITFEEKGNEMPGTKAGDVIFVVEEKQHLLFSRREGADLELGVEIPLVQALTGCTLSVPLLGKQETSLTIDDIIHPGDEKIIAGEGMPKLNEPGSRGDLIVTFLVEFPDELTEEQRAEIAHILEDMSYD